jgi:hypothetical protein
VLEPGPHGHLLLYTLSHVEPSGNALVRPGYNELTLQLAMAACHDPITLLLLFTIRKFAWVVGFLCGSLGGVIPCTCAMSKFNFHKFFCNPHDHIECKS